MACSAGAARNLARLLIDIATEAEALAAAQAK
jgi:hypothetical protein